MRRLSAVTGGHSRDGFKILVIAGLRYPIAEPFVGGLESHTWSLARGLRARGHTVVVAGASGSDPDVVDHERGRLPIGDASERPDTTDHPVVHAAERAAFAALMDDLRTGLLGSFDLVHNNSLHSLPVEQAYTLPFPLLSTLHTPPLPWADRVFAADHCRELPFVAVSEATARSWHPMIAPAVVRNGIDVTTWRPGPGGPGAVWFGRIVPEKAPHLAIDIAQASGLHLTLAGPIIDGDYFQARIAPRLGDRVHYSGHLNQHQLVDLVGHSALAVVTPVWDEPFGMVVAEALACGTPVVALARGGIPEILDARSGRLVPPIDPNGMTPAEARAVARAVAEALQLDRADVRRRAVRHCSQSTMLRGYERLYSDLVDHRREL